MSRKMHRYEKHIKIKDVDLTVETEKRERLFTIGLYTCNVSVCLSIGR